MRRACLIENQTLAEHAELVWCPFKRCREDHYRSLDQRFASWPPTGERDTRVGCREDAVFTSSTRLCLKLPDAFMFKCMMHCGGKMELER
jgi:hypothetical protein